MKNSNVFAPAAITFRSTKKYHSLSRVSPRLRPLSFRAMNLARRAVIFLSSLTLAALLPVSAPAAGRKKSQAGAAKPDAAKAASIERGKKLFTSYGCYECHGRAAQGGTGPRLGPDPVPFSVFLQFVRRPPTAMPNMPPFTAKVASDQDLKDIYVFLSSLPEPPKVKDIPLLKQ